jgi:hypothetical protein
MAIRRVLGLLAVMTGLAWSSGLVGADDPRERPSHFPLPRRDGSSDLQKLFEDRLRQLELLRSQEFEQFLRKILPEADVRQLIDTLQRRMKEDPAFADQLRQLIEQSQGKPLPPETIEQFKRWFDQLSHKRPPKKVEPPDPLVKDPDPIDPEPRPPRRPGQNPPSKGKRPDWPADPTDEASRALAREQIDQFLRAMERLAGKLEESPALQQAVRDLTKSDLDLQSSTLPPEERLDAQLAGLNQYVRDSRDWFRDSWKALKKLDFPAMPAVDWPSMGLPDMGGLPGVSLPAFSGVPGAATGWEDILGLIVLCVLAVLGWKLLQHVLAAPRDRDRDAWRLGPWPVDPARIASRAELVLAFEYLSLLRLGYPARHWNHREIAERLAGDREDNRRAAAGLADAYEQARYAPESDPLQPEALAAARRDLCFLAGVPAV